MLFLEVAAMRGHIALHGSKSETSKAVADALTVKTDFSRTVDVKRVRDTYERLQRKSDAGEHGDALLLDDMY